MKRVIAPLRDFLHRESSSGTLILIASAFGLIAANSGLADTYFAFAKRFGQSKRCVR